MLLPTQTRNGWHNLMLVSAQTGTIGITLCSRQPKRGTAGITLCSCHPKQGTAGITLCSRQPKRGTAGITLCSRQPKRGTVGIDLCSRQPKRGTAGIRILQGISAWLFVRKPQNPHGFLRKKPYFCPVEQAFCSNNSALASAQTS